MKDDFIETVWQYFRDNGRELPWRLPEADGSFDPYRVLVSEIMLQQTQVSRVVPKFLKFVERFPTAQSLAKAPLATVLKAWSGLGYNRRALYLHRSAQQLSEQPFPQTIAELVRLPGVGANTAAAVLVYVYNQPQVFIETNIRTVYIHHFFSDQLEAVDDKQLLPLIEQTIDQQCPREWFWALMDYGSYLKATIGNTSRRSKQYAKQSTFQGSRRQIRGQVIKSLGSSPQTLGGLTETIADKRLAAVLDELLGEGMIVKRRTVFRLP